MSAAPTTRRARSLAGRSPASSGSRAATGLLADPLVRTLIGVVGVLLPAYLVMFAGIRSPRLFAAWIVVWSAAVILAVFRPGWIGRATSAAGERRERAAHLLVPVIGIGLFGPLLGYVVEVDVALVGPAFAAIVIASLCAMPDGRRLPLAMWALGVWTVVLLASGIRDVPTLSLNLGGGLLALAATHSTSRVLSRNLLDAEAYRSAAELRAGLLASVLRTNSLDPDHVFRATVDGLVEAGFDLATIRSIDHERQAAILIEGASRHDIDLEVERRFAGTWLPEVLATRAALVAAAPGPHALLGPHQLMGLVHLPLFDGDDLHAIISVGLRHRTIDAQDQAAAELLAEQADAALRRAHAYRADAATVEQLHRVDVRIHDFVSTVSHELRTPLTVIQGLGQTLRTRWDDLPGEQRQDLLGRIDANAERLASMVRSLIDTSAFQSGQLEPRPEPLAVRAAVHRSLHRLVSVTSRHPVTVEIDASLVAEVDPGLFQHVVENLLTNVQKHTPPGTRVVIRARIWRDRIVISVRDHGPGIAVEDLPYVLDRFYRGGDPDRRTTSGLGLGLALAQEIVQAHGGTLAVTSDPGEGTRFSFDVPVGDAPDR